MSYEVKIGDEYTEDDGWQQELTGLGWNPWDSLQSGTCPDCGGEWVWFEAGYVPGTRRCNGCGSMFSAMPTGDGKARIRQDLGAAAQRVSTTQVRVEQVHGDVQGLRREVGELRTDVRELGEQARSHHAAQMKAFQDVVAEVRSDRDAKIAELQNAVAQLQAQVSELLAARQ